MKHTACLLIGAVLGAASCAPKATLVEQPVPAVKQERREPPPVLPEEPLAPLPDDGLRMGDMLAMPGDNDFRATNPAATRTNTDPGAVISRPPTDPPSRVKPKAEGEE